eukprot:TRINITY_DN5453_c0_g2_i5.p2 TRINITY_DN5453_c0_g2~~TRINITY_DN5453_c0_g2_i5.p2  ORF type:complete len:106 (-),score=5.75 TRINITY_DN5453_c0_g2_i5:32-349(-)
MCSACVHNSLFSRSLYSLCAETYGKECTLLSPIFFGVVVMHRLLSGTYLRPKAITANFQQLLLFHVSCCSAVSLLFISLTLRMQTAAAYMHIHTCYFPQIGRAHV